MSEQPVFERPECTWNYCPHPDRCQLMCQHEREPEERELDADDELIVRAAWLARVNRTDHRDELAKLRASLPQSGDEQATTENRGRA